MKSLFTEEPGTSKQKSLTLQHINNFEDHTLDIGIQEGIKLIPSMFECLHLHSLLNVFFTIVHLIAGGKFLVDNIAFLLLLEVPRGFGISHTSQIYYSDETKLFQ